MSEGPPITNSTPENPPIPPESTSKKVEQFLKHADEVIAKCVALHESKEKLQIILRIHSLQEKEELKKLEQIKVNLEEALRRRAAGEPTLGGYLCGNKLMVDKATSDIAEVLESAAKTEKKVQEEVDFIIKNNNVLMQELKNHVDKMEQSNLDGLDEFDDPNLRRGLAEQFNARSRRLHELQIALNLD